MWWLIGAVSWIIDTYRDYQDKEAKKKAIEAQKEDARKKYEENVRYLNSDFQNNKTVAYDNAAQTDKSLTKSEGYLSSEYNNVLAQLGLAQKQTSLEVNDSLINTGSQIGQSLSSQALSGTRGSSAMGAIERQSAYLQDRAQQSREISNKMYDLQLNQYALGMAQSRDSITEGRYQSNYLRRSYEEGGSNWNTLQNKLTNLSVTNEIDNTAYDRQIQYIEEAYQRNKKNLLDLGLDILQSANMGYNFVTNLTNFTSDWGSLFGTGNHFNSALPNVGYQPLTLDSTVKKPSFGRTYIN